MVVFGTTTIFFSPSLYFSVISSPSTPLTICATVALVMVLFGVRSHGRCPSPVPRKASGKMWISTAFWLPSGPPIERGPVLRFDLGGGRRDEARYSPPNPAFKTWNHCP